MATTEVDICNIALFRVGAGEIGSLTEKSVAAEKCRVLYPQARDVVLTEAAWPFATATRSLGLKAEQPEEWEFAYGYPNDCLTVQYIVPVANSRAFSGSVYGNADVPIVPFDVMLDSGGSSVIVTNQESAKICYTKKIEDVRIFTPMFVESVAWLLAQDLAPILGGKSANYYLQRAALNYASYIGKAKAHAKSQTYPRMRRQLPKSIQARGQSLQRPYRRD